MDSTRLRHHLVLPLALLALASCAHELDGPTPVVNSLDPALVCTEQLTTRVDIAGDGLSPLAEEALTTDPLLALPRVTLSRTRDLMGGTVTGSVDAGIPDDPRNPAQSHVHWTSQQLLSFDIYPDLHLAPGIYDIEVANANGKKVSKAGALVAVPPPKVDKIEPNPVCNAQGTSTLVLTGSGFLVVGTAQPTVTIDGLMATVTKVEGCVAIAGAPVGVMTCTSITATVPQGTLTVGTHQVTVTNPAPANCSTAPTFTLTVVPPPTITKVEPAVICAGGGDLVITGTNFGPERAVVIIGNVEATVRRSTSTSTRLEVTIGEGLVPGVYDVTVDNRDGCMATLEDALTVTPGPSVYFIDPPTVYSGTRIQGTIYVTGLLAAPTSASLRPAAGGDVIPLQDRTFDPARPNRILATIPSGLAAGDYDVLVSDGQCSATLPAGLHVESTLTVAIGDVAPPFGWTSEDTAITTSAVNPAPSGQKQFQATPRVYLNPKTAGQLARPLEAVAFVNAQRLTAVVPSGLAPGSYDLIVVNPDRSVGLKANAFLVTAVDRPPPIIDTLTPGSVVNQPGQVVKVLGDHFRGPKVTATCVDDATAQTTVINGGALIAAATSISATFDMGALSSGVCVVRVTNDDNTYVDFSALAVSNPAQNLIPTVADKDMATARRGLSAVAGRVTSQARYVYAIGGDDGTDNGVLASMEAAPVSLFGALDPWFTLPTSLPAGRAGTTAAVIGRYIYLVGGRLAGGPSASVLRAQILDPRDAVDVNDLIIVPGEGNGLDPGLFYYRVAAVMEAGNFPNPSGEALASDPFGVVVPPLPGKAKLTVIWDAVPGAGSYRVYRTPTAGALVGTAQLVGTVQAPANRFVDSGAAPMAGTPRPEGSLGNWREVGVLPTPREGAGVAVAADPDGPGAFFLYAIGGRTTGGAALATYTFARIAVGSEAGAIAFAADAALPTFTARWQLAAVAVDHARAPLVTEGDTWIYAMGGYTTNKAVVPDVTAGKVSASGALTSVADSQKMSPGIAGYGYAVANGFLFSFGGAGGNGIGGVAAKSAKIAAPLPALENWNDEGSLKLKQARYLPGSALESAFIFLVGGASDTAAATKTTERTHW